MYIYIYTYICIFILVCVCKNRYVYVYNITYYTGEHFIQDFSSEGCLSLQSSFVIIKIIIIKIITLLTIRNTTYFFQVTRKTANS